MAAHADVFWAGLTDASDRLVALLPAADLDRIKRLHRKEDRDRGILTWALARAVLGGRLSMDPASITIDRTCRWCGCSNGKPRLANQGGLDFSISHSGQFVAVAVTDAAEVGVDVEAMPTRSMVGDLRDFIAAPGERVDTDLQLIRQWVRKEAVVKAVGSGMRTPFSEFAVSAPDQPAALLTWPADPTRPSRFTLIDLPDRPGHLAAVALTCREATVSEHDGAALLRARIAGQASPASAESR